MKEKTAKAEAPTIKAEDFEFRFEATIGDEINWHGHAMYKKLPYSAMELIGTQINSKNSEGFTTPMKYASANSEFGTETLFWMNINAGGTMASADVEIFNMRFPVKGFVNIAESGRMSVCLKADIENVIVKKEGKEDKLFESRYNYVTNKIKNKEKTNNGKEYTPYILEAPGSISEEALKEYTASLSNFEEWKKRNIKQTIKETGVKSPLLSGEVSF
jgi:hypothetical protein